MPLLLASSSRICKPVSDKMNCPGCGSEVREGANFCGQCGRKLERPSAFVATITLNTPPSAPKKERGKAGPLPPTPCPACGKVIEGAGSAKVKCPGCGHDLHVLVDPETKERKLLDEEGKSKLLKRKEELKVMNKGVRLFGQYGVTKETIENELARLKKDGRDWGYPDAVWALTNKLALDAMREGEFHKLKLLYYGQALFLEFEGKDPVPLLVQSNEVALRTLQPRSGIVKISVVPGCDACREMDGRQFTVEEALRTHPIPNPGCTHRFEEGHYPFCRCMYLPVVEDFR